jgi:hypothetical protein
MSLWLLNLYDHGLYVGWFEILRDFMDYQVCMDSSTLIYLFRLVIFLLNPVQIGRFSYISHANTIERSIMSDQ